MSAEENKNLARQLMEIPHTGDYSKVDELISEDFVYRASSGEEYHGRDGFRELVETYRQAFPDLELVPKQLVAEGDTVIAFVTQRGTHRGSLMDIPASGNSVSLPMFSKLEFRDGQLADLYEVFDSLDLMRQLGAIDEEESLGGWQPPSGEAGRQPRV